MQEVYTNSVIFKCVTGPDQGKRIVIREGDTLSVGRNPKNNLLSDDPFVSDSHVQLSLRNGRLLFNADPENQVFLDGRAVLQGDITSPTQQLRIGSSTWGFASSEKSFDGTRGFTTQFSDRISTLAGVEKLEGFRLGDLFSAIFEKKTDEDIEEEFITGTRRTTPTLLAIQTSWPKPWAFFRLLIITVGVFIAFYYALIRFNNPILLPGLIFVGSFAIPFSCLVFFLEMNAPKNVSLFQVMRLLFIGGILSIILSLFLFEITSLGNWLSASSAGIIEETGKLAAVILLMHSKTKYHWILNGLLFGAAVGTGFAVFESAGYAIITNDMMSTIILRAILSPLAHVIWTACTAAALWKVKGNQPFRWEMVQNPIFLRTFITVMVMHMLWNAPFGIPFFGAEWGSYGKMLLLGLVGWIIVLGFVQEGLKQIQKVQQLEREREIA